MVENKQNSKVEGDIANEIISLTSPVAAPAGEAHNSGGVPPASDSGGSALESEEPVSTTPVLEATQYRYLYPGKGYKPHRDLIAQGKDPRSILDEGLHIPWGRARGCECFDCKKKRGEVFELQGIAPIVREGPDAVLGDLLTEKFISRILNLPNRVFEMLCRLRKLPAEVVELWKTDAEELELYGRYGKQLADYYLRLPDFKHKNLILFGIWYLSNVGQRIVGMIMVLKLEGKKNGAPKSDGQK